MLIIIIIINNWKQYDFCNNTF